MLKWIINPVIHLSCMKCEMRFVYMKLSACLRDGVRALAVGVSKKSVL